ncbi:hypothetical protein QWJ41_04200 [Nocardioides sp. SOB44]|uniref:Uncharacterized protein n=1 Tax=Nocardioides cremeus TaxID=3058044 RepID=A0ABT8TPH9_9ACTN|nr:hypothetical protein [Nocardioides cremeus]MDO3394908.1 hypothetical protein [Nocardioides cremeus]
MTDEEKSEPEIERYCSPRFFLGALATDGAPMRLAVKISRGYAKALGRLAGTELNEWMQTTAQSCVARGWQEGALAMLCTPSENQRAAYEQRARDYLRSHADTKEWMTHG